MANKAELLKQFEAIPTGNAADAMAKLGIQSGALDSTLFPLIPSQRRTAGTAVTVKQMVRSQAAEGASLAKHSKVIDSQLTPGDLLVIDVGGRTDVCTGGFLLALRAKMQGASGYVINGALRDLEEIAQLDFPVYLAGGSPVKSSPLLETIGINIPVEIGGVQINPGDVVLMDRTGVVVIPVKFAEDVLAKAKEIGAKEEALQKLLEKGGSFAEAAKEVKL